jgi:hypothetical protein
MAEGGSTPGLEARREVCAARVRGREASGESVERQAEAGGRR